MAIRASKAAKAGRRKVAQGTAQMITALRDEIATWRPQIQTDPRPKKANGSSVRHGADIEASARFLLRLRKF
jgi:hypothetical protein